MAVEPRPTHSHEERIPRTVRRQRSEVRFAVQHVYGRLCAKEHLRLRNKAPRSETQPKLIEHPATKLALPINGDVDAETEGGCNDFERAAVNPTAC